LERAYSIGIEAGLRYIYIGNVPGARGESTICYSCGRELIERMGYRILANSIEAGKCPDCGVKIAGYEV
ncbi:MAG: radical SAM protein, partial [Planctomycetes bacterium]|nr:radical SAM protein [Planctomycetota bacterium]